MIGFSVCVNRLGKGQKWSQKTNSEIFHLKSGKRRFKNEKVKKSSKKHKKIKR